MKLSFFQVLFLIGLLFILFQRNFFSNVTNFLNSFLLNTKKRNSTKK